MAKYKIIPSSRTIVRSPISIGHKAEKGVEAIEFDVTAWVETYGSGTLTVIMRRWGDAIPYPIALEIGEDNKATWTLSDIDTAKAGMAYAQLNYIVGDEVVKKSDIYTFRVMDSLTGEGEPPEAYESWLEHLTHLAAQAMAEALDIEDIPTDKTLTIDGGIADAKATGDALSALEDAATEETDKLKADLSTMAETVGDIEQALSDTQTAIEQIKNAKSGLYDFENAKTSGFTITGGSPKWASSSVAKSHVIKIPKGTQNIDITANSEQNAIIAFLSSYAPIVGAKPEFSDGYSTRIIINAGESAEYKIENGMNYLYVLIADTSSNDHTPSVSLTYPSMLTLPTIQGDNDRSGEISALLNAFGLCVLEKGTYIIGASIKMHDSSRLEGHGSAIILSDAVTDGAAIVMGSNCTITGLVISGSLTAAPSTEGTRNGIEWTGDALLTSYIDKCVVSGFSGSGVFLHDTTAKTFRNLLITNCRVTACFVGIDFRRNSEFNRVSNCTIIANYYGIRNRGGNNHIGNCGLDANYCGILIDMDEGDNTGHGGIANCTINHSNHNSGYGLIIKDTGRMLITACNFYYSKIKLENTNGNIINGCGFGNSTGWEITGGECSLFINCMVASAAQTPVTITNNTAAKIVNCYTRDGTVFAAQVN